MIMTQLRSQDKKEVGADIMMVKVAAIPDGAHMNNVSHLMALCGAHQVHPMFMEFGVGTIYIFNRDMITRNGNY